VKQALVLDGFLFDLRVASGLSGSYRSFCDRATPTLGDDQHLLCAARKSPFESCDFGLPQIDL
jgi:hypothetical protein